MPKLGGERAQLRTLTTQFGRFSGLIAQNLNYGPALVTNGSRMR